MNETHLLAKDNRVTINFPINKANIDVENRIVSGWATVDNFDQMGDKVTADASLRAFSNFRGNIREQHDTSKAVGKLLSFSQQDYFAADGEQYTGVWVNAYVSKGAQDTWEKVLDGTLNGFSIGGAYSDNNVIREYIPELNKVASIVTDYNLLELSLVDNPGNELCDIVSIQKTQDLTVESEVHIENVFWCGDDKIALISKQAAFNCSYCSSSMENLGWFELLDDVDPRVEIKKILDEKVTKGGSEVMPEETTQEVVESNVEAPVVEVNEAVEPEVQPVNEEVAVAEEAPEVEVTAEPDLAVLAQALESIQESLARATESDQQRELALTKVREEVKGVEDKVSSQLEKLLEEHKRLADDFTSFKEGLRGIEKRLESVEGSTAFQKSLSVEGASVPETKPTGGFWSNAFID